MYGYTFYRILKIVDLAGINFSNFAITCSINSKICDDFSISGYNFYMSLLRWLGQRGEAEASGVSTLAWRLAQDVAIVALKGSYHCLSTWHLRHRAAAEAGAGLTRVMVDEDNETVGI